MPDKEIFRDQIGEIVIGIRNAGGEELIYPQNPLLLALTLNGEPILIFDKGRDIRGVKRMPGVSGPMGSPARRGPGTIRRPGTPISDVILSCSDKSAQLLEEAGIVSFDKESQADANPS